MIELACLFAAGFMTCFWSKHPVSLAMNSFVFYWTKLVSTDVRRTRSISDKFDLSFFFWDASQLSISHFLKLFGQCQKIRVVLVVLSIHVDVHTRGQLESYLAEDVFRADLTAVVHSNRSQIVVEDNDGFVHFGTIQHRKRSFFLL